MKRHEDAIRQAIEERSVSWVDPVDYWTGFLRRNNKLDIKRLETNYPQDSVVTVDLKKVHDNKIWEIVLESSMGAIIETVQDASVALLLGLNPNGDYHRDGIRVRFVNVPKKKKIGDLRVNDLKDLIGITCLVKRITEIRPKILKARFMCAAGHITEVYGGFNSVAVPDGCSTDGCTLRRLKHVGDRDVMTNRQFAYVQELLDEMKSGGQPRSLKVELVGDLCNRIMVGDRVTLNGAYRAVDKYKGENLDSTKDVYFDCNNAEIGERDFDDVVISEEDEKRIVELSKNPKIFETIEKSIAPTILGMSLLKRAITLQLFGGVTKTMPDGVVVRGYINVLCISDPSMAKSVLLKFVSRVSPRGIYVDCTNASKVGLIAPVIKDELTGQWAVEAGAYMLASGGTLCADEISELGDDGFKAVHEAMENGEVHITKAGLNVTAKTTASLLAACNPKKGRFTIAQSLPEQVSIPPAVLSRFDLVVLLQDIPSKKTDLEIAKHITDAHMTAGELMNGIVSDNERTRKIIPPMEPDILRKYVAYARKINPLLTQEAADALNKYYVEIRPFTDTGETVAVTTRQQSSLTRMAEARARMSLRKTVTTEDANEAIELFDQTLRCVAIDPATGKLDTDRISNISTAQSRNMQDCLMRAIDKIGGTTHAANESALFDEMTAQNFDIFKVRRMVDELALKGKLYYPRNGIIRVM